MRVECTRRHSASKKRESAQYLGILLKKYIYIHAYARVYVEKVEADACIMTFSVRFVLLSARTPARGGSKGGGKREREKENGDRVRASESSASGFMSFGP